MGVSYKSKNLVFSRINSDVASVNISQKNPATFAAGGLVISTEGVMLLPPTPHSAGPEPEHVAGKGVDKDSVSQDGDSNVNTRQERQHLGSLKALGHISSGGGLGQSERRFLVFH